jgi:hypothetical protein
MKTDHAGAKTSVDGHTSIPTSFRYLQYSRHRCRTTRRFRRVGRESLIFQDVHRETYVTIVSQDRASGRRCKKLVNDAHKLSRPRPDERVMAAVDDHELGTSDAVVQHLCVMHGHLCLAILRLGTNPLTLAPPVGTLRSDASSRHDGCGRPTTRSQTWRTFFANYFGDHTLISPVMFADAEDEDSIVDASDVSLRPAPSIDGSCVSIHGPVAAWWRSRQLSSLGVSLGQHLQDHTEARKSSGRGPPRHLAGC